MRKETVISTCDCSDEAHIITLNLWEWDEDLIELYIGVQLNPHLGIFKRIWVALKYILGKRSKFSNGHWDSGCFSRESAIEARKLLDSFIEKRTNDTI